MPFRKLRAEKNLEMSIWSEFKETQEEKEERKIERRLQNQKIIKNIFFLTSGAGAFGFLTNLGLGGILTTAIAIGIGFSVKSLFEYIDKEKRSKSILKGVLFNLLLIPSFLTIGLLPIFSDSLDISLVLLLFFSICFIAFITYLKIKNYE